MKSVSLAEFDSVALLNHNGYSNRMKGRSRKFQLTILNIPYYYAKESENTLSTVSDKD